MINILNIGNNIRYFRKNLGMTQEQLAENSGLSVNFISRLERTSDQNVSIKTLDKIAQAFQISLAELVTIHDEETTKSSEEAYLDKLTYKMRQLDAQKATELNEIFLHIINISTK